MNMTPQVLQHPSQPNQPQMMQGQHNFVNQQPAPVVQPIQQQQQTINQHPQDIFLKKLIQELKESLNVVGGVATQYFGTKNVFGWSQFATAACSLCIPFASSFHYGALIALRLIQGFASGLTWPAMYAIVVYWIPPVERSRFMSSFQGFSIGIGLTYPLCGFIISHWGWRAVFYTTGSIGMGWCTMWYFLAFICVVESSVRIVLLPRTTIFSQ